MVPGTNSKPVLEQRMASDGERLWHMQRFGHGCPLHAAASNSKENHNCSIILHREPGNWKTGGKRAMTLSGSKWTIKNLVKDTLLKIVD